MVASSFLLRFSSLLFGGFRLCWAFLLFSYLFAPATLAADMWQLAGVKWSFSRQSPPWPDQDVVGSGKTITISDPRLSYTIEGTATLTLSVPDTIRQGEPFNLTLTASGEKLLRPWDFYIEGWGTGDERDNSRVVTDSASGNTISKSIDYKPNPDGSLSADVTALPRFKDGTTKKTVPSAGWPAYPLFQVSFGSNQDDKLWLWLWWELVAEGSIENSLIYDQVEHGGPPIFQAQAGIAQQALPQFLHPGPGNVMKFKFNGRSTDGMVGLRVVNTRLHELNPPPLRMDLNTCVREAGSSETLPCVRVLRPSGPEVVPFILPNMESGNAGLQFNVTENGVYTIEVRAEPSSAGPFPASFQIHLSGNVGHPERTGVVEPHATRHDILVNHPVPRPQALVGANALDANGNPTGQTALFKFANSREISQFPKAVILGPGTVGGPRLRRAADPFAQFRVTTPTARTPACFDPTPGIVIDFTQVPIPTLPDGAPLNNCVCAVLGPDPADHGVDLPVGGVSSLILDMGSGEEIVDGTGNDFRVNATGSYTVSVSNTPFAETFVPIGGTVSGVQEYELGAIGFKVVRYVQVTAGQNTRLDDVMALNLFSDLTVQGVGSYAKEPYVTIMARRAKGTPGPFNPELELIGADGVRLGENNSGYGDKSSAAYTDPALINIRIPTEGFQRYTVRGSRWPRAEAFGSFFTRLETPGDFDATGINVSSAGESALTTPQRQGVISEKRERDSYLFEGVPGQTVNISVKSQGTPTADFFVELFDSEDFLIAANDNAGTGPQPCRFPERGSDPVLCVTLPATTADGNPLPNTSTFRIVVGALDVRTINETPLSEGRTYMRQAASGQYELRVFTGSFVVAAPPDADSDGLSDSIEGGAPNNGDGNGDGTPDNQQANVVSFPNRKDQSYVTLASDAGTKLADAASVANPSAGNAPAATFPADFLSFSVLDGTAGSAGAMTIAAVGTGVVVELHFARSIVVDTYYNFGPTPGNAQPHWYEFLYDGTTGAEIQNTRILLHFVDGQRGDHDGLRNGRISTLGGPALKTSGGGPSYSLYFPYYQADATQFCGYAASNYSQKEALLQFTSYRPDGTVADFARNPASFLLAPQRQVALQGSEIFQAPPSQVQNAWMELVTDTRETGSFFMVGNGAGTELDGSVAFDQQYKKFYFTRVFEGDMGFFGEKATTMFSVANPNTTQVRVALRFHSSFEETVRSAERVIPAHGFFSQSATELFGAEAFQDFVDGYVEVEVTEGTGAVGFELIQLKDTPTLIGLNASVVHPSSTELFSAQLANSESTFTDVSLVNVSDQQTIVTVEAVKDDGTSLGGETYFLEPGEYLAFDAGWFFGLDPAEMTTGSIRIEGGPGLIGDVIFGDYTTFSSAAGLPLQATKFRKAVFSQVANIPGLFFTGIALYNPGTESAAIVIDIYTKEGQKSGTANVTLEAGERTAKLLLELAASTANQVGGYIVIQSDQPIVAQQLFGDYTLTRLSSVPPAIVE